jgi:hypothetical protein
MEVTSLYSFGTLVCGVPEMEENKMMESIMREETVNWLTMSKKNQRSTPFVVVALLYVPFTLSSSPIWPFPYSHRHHFHPFLVCQYHHFLIYTQTERIVKAWIHAPVLLLL